MRTYRIILSLCTLAIALAVAYSAFMFVYTDYKFAPISFLIAPNRTDLASTWETPQLDFIHQINTPARAQKKAIKYDGLEIDVWLQDGQLLAAHDSLQAQAHIPLEAIFAAVKDPAQKFWWLDIKSDLTSKEIETIVQLANRYQIPLDHLLFEATGNTALAITQKQLPLLLPLPEGFDQDNNDPTIRTKLNADALALWEKYHPTAISASFGKYAYLQTYFPNVPKAIYYSATKRPSIKKNFMRRHMRRDKSVKIFMVDEYDWINL